MRYVIADPSKPIEIGYERDAKTMNVHFDVSDFIKDYPGCTCHLSYIRPTVTQPYEPENTRIIGSELVWNVSAADAEFSGYGSVQIVMFRNSDQVAHSPEMTVHVNESHDSTAEPPEEPIQAWFVRVMAAQDEAKDLAEKVLSMTVEVETLPAGSEATAEYDAETGVMHFGIPAGEDGAPGPHGLPGDDGFSPEVTIRTITGGHSITITDIEHPEGQTFNVMNGAKGDSGFAPVVTVTEIEGGHSVKITDEVHPTGQTFNVMDGEDGKDISEAVAPEFESGSWYEVGDRVMHDGKLFVCNTYGYYDDFDTESFDETTVVEELENSKYKAIAKFYIENGEIATMEFEHGTFDKTMSAIKNKRAVLDAIYAVEYEENGETVEQYGSLVLLEATSEEIKFVTSEKLPIVDSKMYVIFDSSEADYDFADNISADEVEYGDSNVEVALDGLGESVSQLNQAIDTLPTSETGSEWANKEELNTELVDQFVGEVDRMFSTGLPQESTMGRVITQLSLGNGLLNDLYIGMEVS